MSQLSRRRFIFAAGASAAGSLLLHGCLGNPPSATQTGSPSNSASSPVAVAGEAPETTQIKLGYLPIVEAAPLIIAKHKGLFAKYGMPDVEVSKQANWGSARDNVEIGSQGGGIDGGQWQMPMPHLISEGLITKGNKKIPMYVLAQLVTQGNGIAVANKHLGKGIHAKMEKQAVDYLKGLKAANTPFKAAYTFPKVNQDFWIRYWLAANGIDPDQDLSLLTVPAAQTVANMKTGTMDAFSTGDPWPYRIIEDKIGFLSALTAQIWRFHPEEYLAIRGDWVDKNPKATKAVLKAVMEAQQWCDKPENREELVNILAGREYFNVPAAVLKPPFEGKYDLGDGQPAINDFKMGPLYWKDDRGSVSYPYKSHDLWFITESVRWGFLPAKTLDDAQRIVNSVNREDIWREAAKELGVPDADIPKETSRGVETFFDGKTF
ncbi:MAG TPA: CmpA/NrtA family ABC transporter substrate-binding protein, partial [Stenomitos sp.]